MDNQTSPAKRPLVNIYTRQRLWGLFFVAPALVFFAIFCFYPMFSALYYSLTNYNLIQAPKFIGLAQYAAMLKDPRFLVALENTFIYAFGSALRVVLSLALGLVFVRDFRGRNLLRTLYFAPVVMAGVVVAMVWRVLYNPLGPINATLGLLFGIAPFWLTTRNLAPVAIIIINIWQSIGFYMVLFIAGLQAIPVEFYDSAKVDGASAWASFWNITLPLLKPTTIFVIAITFINSFQGFTYQYVMTRGGPNDATDVIGLYVYQNAFEFQKMGYAAALSVVLFVIIMVLTLIQLKFSRTEDVSYV
jgi:multiple sugar transport system permease protein